MTKSEQERVTRERRERGGFGAGETERFWDPRVQAEGRSVSQIPSSGIP